MAEWFDARRQIDEADFKRQIEAAENQSVTGELREFITNGREAADAMREAKRRALAKARKNLLRQIEAKHDAIYAKHFFPVAASEDVGAWLDQGLIKVKS